MQWGRGCLLGVVDTPRADTTLGRPTPLPRETTTEAGGTHLTSMHSFSSSILPLQVLLVGMGADEQLVGYSRHRVKFKLVGFFCSM